MSRFPAFSLISLIIAILVYDIVQPVYSESSAQQPLISTPSNFSTLKSGIVSIKANKIKSPYSAKGTVNGTGFLVNKKLGLVLTNAHIAQASDVQELLLTFSNGQQLEAKLLYQDPHHDISALVVDPKRLPDESIALELADYQPSTEQKVVIIGNNQNNNFSIQDGVINAKYVNTSFFPGQYISISVNIRGGASGSPVFDQNGKVLGIVFGGNDTFVNALPVQYISDMLDALVAKKIPSRKDMGAILSFYSLDDLVKFWNFPESIAKSYIIENPQYLNSVLVVNSILSHSPADGLLEPGDVIFAANNKVIGAGLYDLQKIMNQSSNKVLLTIYRNGVKKDLAVGLYDLNRALVRRMLLAGDAVFFEADDIIRSISGIPLGSVVVSSVSPGSTFDVFPYGKLENSGYLLLAKILKVDGHEIKSLDDLARIIPDLIKKKSFVIQYLNFAPYIGYDYVSNVSHSVLASTVTYNNYGLQPVMLEFDPSALEWKQKPIIEKEQ